MKLGFSPLTAGLSYLKSFDLAAQLGLFLEIAYDQHEMDPRLPGARELAEMARAAGVGFTLHLPFVDWNIASLVPPMRRLSLERTQRAIAFGAEIGAACGVLHTGLVPLRLPEAVAHAQQLINEALERLELAIPVALENLGLSAKPICWKPPADLAEPCWRPTLGMASVWTWGTPLSSAAPAARKTYHRLAGPAACFIFTCTTTTATRTITCPAAWVRWTGPGCGGRWEGFAGTAALEVTGGEAGVRQSVALLLGKNLD
ncbi:MAG: xylose isomerase [Meiothermus sp.]|nr:MAG: xylose isomerase [Meiothermus sp.]